MRSWHPEKPWKFHPSGFGACLQVLSWLDPHHRATLLRQRFVLDREEGLGGHRQWLIFHNQILRQVQGFHPFLVQNLHRRQL